MVANAGKDVEKMALSDVAVTSVRRFHPFGEPFITKWSMFTLVWWLWATQNVTWTVASASERVKLKFDLMSMKFNTQAVQSIVNTVVWYVCAKSLVMFNFLWPHGLSPARLLCPWDSPCENTPRPPPEGLPNPGVKIPSLVSPALAAEFFTTSATWEAHSLVWRVSIWIDTYSKYQIYTYKDLLPKKVKILIIILIFIMRWRDNILNVLD